MRIACCRTARAVKRRVRQEKRKAALAAASTHRRGSSEVSHIHFAKWEVFNLVPLKYYRCGHKCLPGLADSTERRRCTSAWLTFPGS